MAWLRCAASPRRCLVMLGKRYRDLTKQCLECDSAFGDDLSKPRLQQAVYEHVVCGLTEMIRTLDI